MNNNSLTEAQKLEFKAISAYMDEQYDSNRSSSTSNLLKKHNSVSSLKRKPILSYLKPTIAHLNASSSLRSRGSSNHS